uniref:PDZ domain-containing protein n=1 Tax=Periophthalmus magnuspinnatus TaxID=409849 RepID=A0A3B4A9D9_9GOBI
MPQTVTLMGPSPWGFRLVGGRDFSTPLTVSRVSRKSRHGNSSSNVVTSSKTHLELCFISFTTLYYQSVHFQSSKRSVPPCDVMKW